MRGIMDLRDLGMRAREVVVDEASVGFAVGGLRPTSRVWRRLFTMVWIRLDWMVKVCGIVGEKNIMVVWWR